MSQREAFDFIPMWDRWFQRVCVISILGDNQVSCSVEAFTRQFSKANVATPRPMTEVEKLRRAGFSEREVLEWVETALKTKRQQGMSDAALASYLFGDETRGSKQ